MAAPQDEREARKAYMRQRQKTVFTVCAAGMVVALFVSLLFYYHVGGLGKVKTPAVEPNFGVVTACATKGEDGAAAKYVDPRTVHVQVLNGTTHLGFAGAVSAALENRQFAPLKAGNYPSKRVERTTVYYGKNAVNEAYTVASNFTDAVMVMDDREDKLVNVVLGATFTDLKDPEQSGVAGQEIKDFANCQAVDKLTDVPKTFDHEQVN